MFYVEMWDEMWKFCVIKYSCYNREGWDERVTGTDEQHSDNVKTQSVRPYTSFLIWK